MFVKSGEPIMQQSLCFLFVVLYDIEEEENYDEIVCEDLELRKGV